MKRLLTLIVAALMSFGAWAATPNQYNPNTVVPTGIDSVTGNATVPFVDHASGRTGMTLPLQQDLLNNPNSLQPTRTFGYVYGRNNLVQNVRCDLWEGPTCTYAFPAAAQQMAVSSSSASDAAASTGCQQVMVHYLDNAYAVHTETVTLNGLTPVNTVATNILRINGFHCIQVGTGTTAAGNISLKNTGATVTYAYISAGFDTARQAIYTVPAGVWGYISHWQASSGAASGSHFTQVAMRSTSHDGAVVGNVFLLIDEVGTLNNGLEITLPTPIRIAPMSDVKMSAISDAANANAVVSGAIMGWFETQ